MTKYIKKTIEDSTTGAEVNYHEVTYIGVDLANNLTTATVTSYFSLKAKQKGKHPIGEPKQFTIENKPPKGVELENWLYENLTQAIPEGYQPTPENEQYIGYVDPYMFTGGIIKDSEEKTKAKNN
ncbi:MULTISPECIES: hypothetical protein [Pasteurellaceae]|uniref:Phage protein n=1 Tax=Pasteurella atlantica TaxID=2827233 RepID=A0AAW8CT48_9PAST|nr:hypothetical protein [Pasteurella atlantica]MBR0574664.1 hypothetical protein [Pasteurella atlantica]MDP8040578.1 hypothetical protein [Pasteurella atlantica]MDP8042707.1 hypothetical protein [Pasteurella atlantica]MDP8044792.1 hypothetical protein [Pasteurella atlantica]MDP8046888.1 hypothetical protein [Pasteurella atlantica]